jgi:hypothetical protein
LLLLGASMAGTTPAPAQDGGAEGNYRAVLDIAGGPLRFGLELSSSSKSQICNGTKCGDLPSYTRITDSILIEIPDYAATITAHQKGDSLLG